MIEDPECWQCGVVDKLLTDGLCVDCEQSQEDASNAIVEPLVEEENEKD